MFVFYGCDDSSSVSGILNEGSDSFIFVAGEGDFNTVESGSMTKDLAVLISDKQQWQNTDAFLSTIDKNLQNSL